MFNGTPCSSLSASLLLEALFSYLGDSGTKTRMTAPIRTMPEMARRCQCQSRSPHASPERIEVFICRANISITNLFPRSFFLPVCMYVCMYVSIQVLFIRIHHAFVLLFNKCLQIFRILILYIYIYFFLQSKQSF